MRNPEQPVQLGRDRIEVDGEALYSARKVYFMLNKPRGVVTTASDEKQRKTVYDLLPGEAPWIAPVGRLDMASEGLLLLTNDSEWAAQITDPTSHIDKVYHVQIAGSAPAGMIDTMLKGVRSGNEVLRTKRVRIVREGKRNTWIEIALDEGKNRQIRRMLAELGFEVMRLIRIGIGPLALGKLSKGSYRALEPAEKMLFDRAIAARLRS